ncbi:MAG: DUF2256 and DUF3253 domain-containing protein [Phycisphaerae bacterium]|nr:DUF2256 and DUF3253 domain-containing protein [Phycisphaerae bacterium]
MSRARGRLGPSSPSPASPPEKICVSCGRRMAWRAKWARTWDQVKYCSDACRRRAVRAVDLAPEQAILDLLSNRPGGATICPSEAARAVSDDADEAAWRSLMEPARRAARRLAEAGRIEVTQNGRVVDAATARGPIRLRRR